MTNITLNHITKIEGHAKLDLRINDGKVELCELSAVEGSRYIEGMVRGRQFFEAPEMTSRICGICSCAHVVCSIQAMENALGYTPSHQTEKLRVLLTLGERIRSHATHLYFLALPDYLGFESAIAMAPTHKTDLMRALRLIKTGNAIVKRIGGRDLHPVSATVGGWHKIPSEETLRTCATELATALEDSITTAKLFMTLEQPEFRTTGTWASLKDTSFAVLHGMFTTEKNAYVPQEYRAHLHEDRRDHSTATFVTTDSKRFMVGALARFNNNYEQLRPQAAALLKKSGLTFPHMNPFQNNMCQALELVHCIEHAKEICETVSPSSEEVIHLQPRAGKGVGCIEVPRGTLWHEYELKDDGVILDANIITPTAQNLYNMQEDIREFVPTIVDKTKEQIILEIEKLIRSYDPCFSCSAHFLEVNWK